MDQMSVALGMVSAGFAQNASAFDEGVTLQNGSVTVISMDFNYEFFSNRRSSHVVKLTGSGLAGEVGKYYAFGYAKRYYFGSEGTRVTLNDDRLTVKMVPKLRYYAGFNGGLFYMVYKTEKEVRSDIGVEVGGHGGILYSAGVKRSYKAELNVLRGTGVETSSMNIGIFFGASFYMEPLF